MPCWRAGPAWRWWTNWRTATCPGSRHERRWQDVIELLDAGIDVYTTVNIQHLESLNDVVHRITGVRVSETVPDLVFDRLRDILLVDLPPRELIERLQQGKVYVPEQAAHALQAFFSPSNLTALRELAMQTAADRVDSDLRETQAARGLPGLPLRRRVLVAIDGQGPVGIPGARVPAPGRTARRSVDGRERAGRRADRRAASAGDRPCLCPRAQARWRRGSPAWRQHRRCAAGPRSPQRRLDDRARPHP